MATNEQDAEQAASDIEIEWQFDALDLRPIERWLAALPARASELRQAGQATSLPAIALSQGSEGSSDASADGAVTALTALAKPSRRLVDRYLDTDDWRVARAGYVLRTRRHGRHDEATLKSLKPASTAGLRQRQELTELLPSGDIEQLSSDGPVGGRVGAMAGKKSLRQVLEVRTRRRPFSLRIGTQEVAELALDDTTIVGGDEAPVRLRRVEVEVDPVWITGLEPIVDDLVAACGLRVATLSKFEAGLLGLGLGLPGAPDLGPTTVTPSSTMAEAAFAVIRRHIRQLILREPGTRLGEDVEELHDMRVATRRIRAALDLFQDVLPVRAQTLRARSSVGSAPCSARCGISTSSSSATSPIAHRSPSCSVRWPQESSSRSASSCSRSVTRRVAACSWHSTPSATSNWSTVSSRSHDPARPGGSPSPGLRRRSRCPSSWTSGTGRRPRPPAAPGAPGRRPTITGFASGARGCATAWSSRATS